MTVLRIATVCIHVALFIVIILMVLSGYGITEYRAVGAVTFGVLTKPLSFRIHTALIIPLIVLLSLHIVLVFWKKLRLKT